jgi:hypothetical protein
VQDLPRAVERLVAVLGEAAVEAGVDIIKHFRPEFTDNTVHTRSIRGLEILRL